jgi:hypothetical protein
MTSNQLSAFSTHKGFSVQISVSSGYFSFSGHLLATPQLNRA